MSLSSQLTDDILTVLRAANLKVGDAPVRNILTHVDTYSVSASQCPCVTIEVQPTGAMEQVTSDDFQTTLAVQIGAWVATSQANHASRERALQLIRDIQVAILGTANFGRSVGCPNQGSWNGFDFLEGADVTGVTADLSLDVITTVGSL